MSFYLGLLKTTRLLVKIQILTLQNLQNQPSFKFGILHATKTTVDGGHTVVRLSGPDVFVVRKNKNFKNYKLDPVSSTSKHLQLKSSLVSKHL